MKSFTLVTYNFKIFRGIIPPDPPKLAYPFGSRSLGFSLLVMLDWRPVETSAKSGDQISGSRLAKDTALGTKPWRHHCTITTSLLYWNSAFIWLLKALNVHIERWICERRIEGGKKQEIEGDHINKIAFNSYCLKLKILQRPLPPTQAVNNDQSLIYILSYSKDK